MDIIAKLSQEHSVNAREQALLDNGHQTRTRRTSLLDVTPQASGALLSSRSSPRLAFRWSGSSCGARLPLLCFFGRSPTAVSSFLPDPIDSASGDPAPDSPGEGGGIGSCRLPSQGGRARSPWSASRARTRGLSIVPGSPPPSAGSSPGSGRRGPPCRRSRWSGCHCGWPSPGEPVRPDSTLRGRVSSSLASSDN